MPPRKPSADGFIVVAVLWILAALATLATIYAVYVSNTAIALGVNEDRLQANAMVAAGLELAAHQLTSAPDSTPARGSFAFRLGAANVAVEFRTEAARMDLNFASKELLAGLFAALGVNREVAARHVDRIVGWRTPPPEGQDPEATDYRMAGRPYAPRGALFPHVDELSLVLGMSADLVERVLPFVTVYSGQAGINVLAAAPQVIAALPGMTPDRVYAILTQRETARPDLPTMMAILGPAQSYATTETNWSTRVNVRVQFDKGRQMSSEVVILVLVDGSEPYRILSWRDELDEVPADGSQRTGFR
jgi:general secretion pathway protein K